MALFVWSLGWIQCFFGGGVYTGDGKWALSPSTPSGSSSLPSLSEDIGQPAQNTSSTQAKVN